MSAESRFGVTGLAVMGANIARNVAHHGIPVAVHNRTTATTERFMEEHGSEGPFTGTHSVDEFVAALERPRTILLMVKAGPPVDAVLDELAGHLDEGDVLLDGGNSHFRDTQRRSEQIESRGLRFVGTGSRAARRARSKGRASCRAEAPRATAPSRRC